MDTEPRRMVVHHSYEPFDIYIGRPSKWATPFELGRDGTPEEVVQKYRQWIITERPDLLKQLHELKGQVLGCCCAPHPCHGDVLVELSSCYPSYKCITCGSTPCGLSAVCRKCLPDKIGELAPSTDEWPRRADDCAPGVPQKAACDGG
jgi:hypothetical protein